jgi:hypothetical protein
MENKIRKLYLVDGKEVNVTQLRELILDAVGDDKITSLEICKRINAEYKNIKCAISTMVTYKFLNSSGNKGNTIYFVDRPCMLQNIFHPMPNFEGKIISTYQHTEDKQKHNDQRMSLTESFNASTLYYLEE